MKNQSSVEDLRTFLPARDFAASRDFYRALGFEEVWSSEKLVLFKVGGFSFFLQDYFVKEWAQNMMIDLRVADVDAYWSQLQSLNLSQRFQTVKLHAPEDDPAARIRRGNFIDPAGVLWHFSQQIK